jgi:hypothetical protein
MNTTTTLTSKQATQLMAALDSGSNLFGALNPGIRARIYRAAEGPSNETWNDAHSIILDRETRTTLWQAVLLHTSYDVTSKSTDAEWPRVPTAQQIVLAIRRALDA